MLDAPTGMGWRCADDRKSRSPSDDDGMADVRREEVRSEDKANLSLPPLRKALGRSPTSP
jgi:hypothetical protein